MLEGILIRQFDRSLGFPEEDVEFFLLLEAERINFGHLGFPTRFHVDGMIPFPRFGEFVKGAFFENVPEISVMFWDLFLKGSFRAFEGSDGFGVLGVNRD